MNALAAIDSLFLPGLGQLAQRRFFAGCVFFVFACFIWIFTLGTLGWIANIVAAIDAAIYFPKKESSS